MSYKYDRTLRLISRAWGRTQSGYAFFPWIDRDEQAAAGTRRAGYHEGQAFHWPQDRLKILQHLERHEDHDMYWCPSLFEYDSRRTDIAMDEHALWADLDERDPRTIQDFPPSMAWETSPGRYQALWLLSSGDIQGASWPGNENQRMTYHVGADQSGWDTTQLLRIPGWANHKYDYRDKDGNPPIGKLLWDRGRTYLPDEFDELPPLDVAGPTALTEAIEDEIEAVDRHAVMARVRLKLTQRIRDLLSAREVAGDRSEVLWEIERSLADAGCTLAEVVAIVQPLVWNKFAGRGDEMKRLILEAGKAIAARPEEVVELLEEERIPKPSPHRLAIFLANVKKPVWLIDGVLTKGAVGFIAGQPKAFKSWVALDMGLSVASGSNFLDTFRVLDPGPVLYIQEEDPAIILRDRSMKIWDGKRVDKLKVVGDGVFWEPETGASDNFDPDIMAYVQQGFIVSDGGWQEWLDETLAQGMDGEPYRLVLMDTLMMVAGEVDENRAQEMTTKIFKPMKQLMRKHDAALQVVHHMRKGDPQAHTRAGQLMLGSVANHAWSEDSLYLKRTVGGDLIIDFESKVAPEARYKVANLKNKRWEPMVSLAGSRLEEGSTNGNGRERSQRPDPVALVALRELRGSTRGITIRQIATYAGINYQQARRQLGRLEFSGRAHRDEGNKWWLGKKSAG